MTINDCLVDSPGQVQKIYGSPKHLNISVRIPGKTVEILLGRGASYEGIWLLTKKLPAQLRIQDKLLGYLRSHMVGALLQEVLYDPKDRAIAFRLSRMTSNFYLLYFWKGREAYFAHIYTKENQTIAYTSWSGHLEFDQENIFCVFDSVGRRQINTKKARKVSSQNPVEEELDELKSFMTEKRKLKQLRNKIKKIEFDIEKLSHSSKIRTELIENNLDLAHKRSILIKNIKFKLDSTYGHFKNREIIFNKLKQFDKALELQSRRLDTALEELEHIEKNNNIVLDKVKIKQKMVSPIWKSIDTQANKSITTTDKRFKEFSFNLNEQKVKIAIGLNSEGNDYLRSKWASKNDYWFHLDGLTSSHIILKGELHEQILLIVASALADFSNHSGEWIPVIYTQVKNLKGVKGKKGLVTYKKEKHINLRYNSSWKENIMDA